MIAFIYQWIDFIWLPVTFLAVHKSQRVVALAFVLCCLLSARTQIEMMNAFGYPTGVFPFLDGSLFIRGTIVYSLVILLYLVLAHYSPRVRQMVLLSASISIYIIGFCLAMAVMVL